MTKRHDPPPTRFAPSRPGAARSAQPSLPNRFPAPPPFARPAAARSAPPPPVRFGGAQAKMPAPAPPRPAPPPQRALQKAAKPADAKPTVSTTTKLFKPEAYDNFYLPSHLVVKVGRDRQGRTTIEVDLTDYNMQTTAHLNGWVEGGDAYVNSLARGRFPDGRGVSYALLGEFARQAKLAGAKRVGLGSPVTEESLKGSPQKADQKDPKADQKDEHSEEQAALHVYKKMGWDVSTALTVIQSFVDVDTLIARAGASGNRWSDLIP